MANLRAFLVGGDLRSDGRANEAAAEVLQDPGRLGELLAAMQESDPVIRGRAAHALEKVSRSKPELLQDHLPRLTDAALTDDVPMVRWHLAMVFGNLAFTEETAESVEPTLLQLLRDPNTFVRSWAISSLTIIGRCFPEKASGIRRALLALCGDPSVAVRNRVAKAIAALEDLQAQIPKSWVKSDKLAGL
jgi:HEAT repeat protein